MQNHIKNVNDIIWCFNKYVRNIINAGEDLQEIHQLSAGKHSLTIQFVNSHAENHDILELKPFINFTTLSKGDKNFTSTLN